MLLAMVPAAFPELAVPAPTGVVSEGRQLLEANRLLEEEVRLAAQRQIYLVVDLRLSAVLVKGRGIELYRIPIQRWRSTGSGARAGVYRVQQRPSVDRTEARLGTDATADPVELTEMPTEFLFSCDPPLQVSVSPPLGQRPWDWVRHQARIWWHLAVTWRHSGTSSSPATRPWLSLTLLAEDGRSLAWTLTDGMPLLVGRSLDQPVAGH